MTGVLLTVIMAILDFSLKLVYTCHCPKQKEDSDKVLIYQLIMTSLMSRILCSSEYIEVDTTYNENTDLPYLFNVTAFDYKVMQWMAVARVRSNKENSQFYWTAFREHSKNTACTRSYADARAYGKHGIIADWDGIAL